MSDPLDKLPPLSDSFLTESSVLTPFTLSQSWHVWHNCFTLLGAVLTDSGRSTHVGFPVKYCKVDNSTISGSMSMLVQFRRVSEIWELCPINFIWWVAPLHSDDREALMLGDSVVPRLPMWIIWWIHGFGGFTPMKPPNEDPHPYAFQPRIQWAFVWQGWIL